MVSSTNNKAEILSCQDDALDALFHQRLIIVTGHYGSGKTSLAIQIARTLRGAGKRVAVCDLDIVNPYFRAVERRAELESAGIRVVSSRFSGGSLDIPALPREMEGALSDPDSCTILDVGGDDRGALALGRYARQIRSAGGYAMYFVVNFFRPRTRTPEDAFAVLREVEAACGIRADALIHNSNLGGETTVSDIRSAGRLMRRLSRLTNLPVAYTAADRRLSMAFGKTARTLWLDFDGKFEKLLWQT